MPLYLTLQHASNPFTPPTPYASNRCKMWESSLRRELYTWAEIKRSEGQRNEIFSDPQMGDFVKPSLCRPFAHSLCIQWLCADSRWNTYSSLHLVGCVGFRCIITSNARNEHWQIFFVWIFGGICDCKLFGPFVCHFGIETGVQYFHSCFWTWKINEGGVINFDFGIPLFMKLEFTFRINMLNTHFWNDWSVF